MRGKFSHCHAVGLVDKGWFVAFALWMVSPCEMSLFAVLPSLLGLISFLEVASSLLSFVFLMMIPALYLSSAVLRELQRQIKTVTILQPRNSLPKRQPWDSDPI